MKQGKEIDYQKEDVLEAIKSSYGIILNVSKKLSCSWATCRKYINKWEETKEALKAENETFGDVVELKAMNRINEDSEQMIRFYLATKFKDRGFTEKKEIAGDKDNPVQIQKTDKLDKIVSKMTDEQRKIFFEIVEKNNGVD